MRGRAARPPWRAKDVEEEISVAGKEKEGGGFFSHHPRPPARWPGEMLGEALQRAGRQRRRQGSELPPRSLKGWRGVEYQEDGSYIWRRPPEGTEGLLMDERTMISRSTRASKLQREYTHDPCQDQDTDRARPEARTCRGTIRTARKMMWQAGALTAPNRPVFLCRGSALARG